MSSIVADELAKIKSFETETEKRRSTLTLNELNYISDKQLHKKDGGDGSGDSPVNAADVRFVTDGTMYSGSLDGVFPSINVFLYYPSEEDYPAIVTENSLSYYRITTWNGDMDNGYRVVAPQAFTIASGNFNVSVVSGSAEIIEIDDEPVLYVTGDCTIQISVKGESI